MRVGARHPVNAALRQDLRWRAVASLVAVAALSSLLAWQGIELTRVDLVVIGLLLALLSAVALAWRPRKAMSEEELA